MALTKRGRRVKAIARALAWGVIILTALWLIGELTTPDTCKVKISEMSEWCKELRYP